MRLELVDIDAIIPHPGNPRQITEDAIKKMAQTIEEYGFKDPIEVQEGTRLIVAGHRRFLAAKLLKLRRVPVLWHTMTDDEALAYLVANNRASEDGKWDRGLLADTLLSLEALGMAPAVMGFEQTDIAKLFDLDRGADEPVTDEEKAAADAEPGPFIERGEHWEIGPVIFNVYQNLDKEALRKAEAMIAKLEKLLKAKATLDGRTFKEVIAERAMAAGVA